MLVAGANYDAADSSLLVLSVDGSGTLQWGRSISLPGLNNWEIGRGICRNVDGTYTTAGSALFPPPGWGYHGGYAVRFNDPTPASACWEPTSHALVPIPMPTIIPSYTVTNPAVQDIAAPTTTGMTLQLTDTYCTTVGVNETEQHTTLLAIPTVTSDMLTLTYTGLDKPLRVDVVDADGRSVGVPLSAGRSETIMDVRGLAEGVYSAQLRWASGSQTVRFVVAR